MKRLSIIIPMYNVEEYVERCVRSLEDQDIPKEDYELICINDGSPDNCREVIEKLQIEYDNIILINQLNQGVSRARNNGIDLAAGRYLLFVDPDDYVDANKLGKILDYVDINKIQICFLGFTFLNLDGSIRTEILYDKYINKTFHGTEAYHLARGDGQTDPDRMVAMLFETDFLNRNNLRYLPDVPYLEDGEFAARVLCMAERCIFDGNPFYLRTTRLGSATNSNLFNTEYATSGFIKAAVNLHNFREVMLLNQVQKEFINQPIVKFVVLSISSTSRFSKFRLFLKTYSVLKENNLKKLCLKECNNYYKWLGRIYNFSGYLLYLYSILRPLTNFIIFLPYYMTKKLLTKF